MKVAIVLLIAFASLFGCERHERMECDVGELLTDLEELLLQLETQDLKELREKYLLESNRTWFMDVRRRIVECQIVLYRDRGMDALPGFFIELELVRGAIVTPVRNERLDDHYQSNLTTSSSQLRVLFDEFKSELRR